MSDNLVKNSGLSLVIAKIALDIVKEINNEIHNVGLQSNNTSGPIVLTSKAEVNPAVTIGATGTGGGVKLFGDTGGIEMTSNNGDINLLANSGTINIGTDSDDGTLNLGSNAGTSATNINSGLNGIDINTNGTMNITSTYLGNNAISIYAGASNDENDVYQNALLLSTAGNGMCTQLLTSGKNAHIILDTEGENADINLLTNGTGSKTKISSDTEIILEQTSALSTGTGITLVTSATTQTSEPSILIDASDGASNILISGGYDTQYGGVTINGGGGPITIGDNSSSTTIKSDNGSINIEAGSHYANVATININTDGTNEDQINIINTSGINYNAINIQSNAIGGGINMSSNGGGITLDDITSSSGTINIGNTNASSINIGNSDSDTTLSGKTLNIEAGSHYGNIGTININTDGTGDDQISIINSQGIHQTAIIMQSNGIGGGINMSVNGGGIVLDDTNTETGYINIGHNTASVINIGNNNATVNLIGTVIGGGGGSGGDFTGNYDGVVKFNESGTDTTNIGNTDEGGNVSISSHNNIKIISTGINGETDISIKALTGGVYIGAGDTYIGTGSEHNVAIGNTDGNIRILGNVNINNEEANTNVSINTNKNSGIVTIGNTDSTSGVDIKTHTGSINLTSEKSNINLTCGNYSDTSSIDIQTHGNESDTISIKSLKGTSNEAIILQTEAPLGGITIKASAGKLLLTDPGSADGRAGTVNIISGGAASGTARGYITMKTEGTEDDTIKITNTKGTSISNGGINAIDISAPLGGIQLSSGTNSSLNPGSIVLQTTGVGDDKITISNLYGAYPGALTLSCINSMGNMLIETNGGGITINDKNGGDIDITAGNISLLSKSNSTDAISLITNGGNDEKILIKNTQGVDSDAIGLVSSAGGITLNGATFIKLTTNSSSDEKIAIENIQGNDPDAINLVASAGGITLQSTLGGVNINNSGTDSVTIGNTDSGAIGIISANGVNINTDSVSNTTIGNTLTGGKVLLNSSTDIDLISTGGNISLNSSTKLDFIAGASESPGKISLFTDGTMNDNITIKNNDGLGADAINIVAIEGGITLNSASSGININTYGTDKIIIGNTLTNIIEITADNITLTTNNSTSEKIVITNTQGTDPDAISLVSSAGGIDINGYNGINIDAGSHYSNVGTINISTDGTMNDQILIINTQGTNTDAISLVSSAGGITLQSTLGGININTFGTDAVNIGNTGVTTTFNGTVDFTGVTVNGLSGGSGFTGDYDGNITLNSTGSGTTTIGNITGGDIVDINTGSNLSLKAGNLTTQGKIELLTNGNGSACDIINIVNNSGKDYDKNISAAGGINIECSTSGPISLITNEGGIIIKDISKGIVEISSKEGNVTIDANAINMQSNGNMFAINEIGTTIETTLGTSIKGGLIIKNSLSTITTNTKITNVYSGSVVPFQIQSSNITITLPDAADMVGQTYTFIQDNTNPSGVPGANPVKFTTVSGGFLGTIISGTVGVGNLDGSSSNLFFNSITGNTVKGDWIEFKGINTQYIMVHAVSSVSNSISISDPTPP